MKFLRIILLLVMIGILLLMLSFPGLKDSKRRILAYRNNLARPSEVTRRELEEAKRLDGKEIMIDELKLLGAFSLCLFGFIRAGKNATIHPGET